MAVAVIDTARRATAKDAKSMCHSVATKQLWRVLASNRLDDCLSKDGESRIFNGCEDEDWRNAGVLNIEEGPVKIAVSVAEFLWCCDPPSGQILREICDGDGDGDARKRE